MAIINVKGRKPRVSTSDGHGYDTKGKETPPLPQRNGQRMKEKEFNEAVQNYLHIELTRCGIEHKDVAPGRSDIPLSTRAKASDAFKADLHLDLHANAFNSILDDKAGGIETFYYGKSQVSKQCAAVIHKYLMQGTKMKDRGIKDGTHLYMINTPKAISVLPEMGFMDNKYDVVQLLSDSYRKECAVELAKAICEIFGMKYIPEKVPISVVKEETKPVKESVRMFKPSSNTLKNEFISFLEKAQQDGILSSKDWTTKTRNDQLTLDDAIALIATVSNRKK